MSRRHPIRRYKPSLDEDQTRDAMKVLEKFVRKKYRNSVLIGTNDYDFNTSELLTPLPPSRPVSGVQFPRLPSRQFTFDRAPSGQESRPPLLPTYTFDFTEHNVKDEIKFDKSKETWLAYISRMLQYFYNYLGVKHVALILTLLAYALVGGFIFMVIELPEQERTDKQFLKLTTKRKSEIQIVYDNSLCAMTLRPLLQSYDESVRKMLAPQVQWKWDYWNSVFYAGTVFTTIGYGNITCRTPIGRLVTILYALFGIPMMLAVLNVIGKALFSQAQSSYMLARRFFRRRMRQMKKSNQLDRAGTIETVTTDDGLSKQIPDLNAAEDNGLFETFPMSLAILLVVIYIFLCSIVFSVWEQWDFFTAVYFSFISMSTVGFGDVIPAQPRYACVFFAFYFVGLALFSMCYAIIQVRWENQYMWALQLIDQEHQELLEHQDVVEEHDERDNKLGVDNASSIRWRSSHYESSASEDTHLEDYHANHRRSTVILDSKDMPVVPPPVLGVFLSRSISIRQQGSLTRSESALSKRKRRSFFSSTTSENLSPVENKSPWLSVSTEQPTSPSPTGPKSASSAASLAQRGLQSHKLSAINEVSDEDTLQSRRGSSIRKLQRLEAVELETPATPKVIVFSEESAPLCQSEFDDDSTETTPLSSQKEDVHSDASEQLRGGLRQVDPPTTLNLRHKASPGEK